MNSKIPFMNPDFMLQNDTAKRLYREHAANMPIIDYHCHLSPKMIAEDHRFSTITELWLEGDHYKWRAMRTNGVDERSAPARTRPTGRSLRNGPKPCPTLCVIRSITGVTWSCAPHSALPTR